MQRPAKKLAGEAGSRGGEVDHADQGLAANRHLVQISNPCGKSTEAGRLVESVKT